MQKLLKIFILLLIANNTYSQFDRPLADGISNYIKTDVKFRGNIKFVFQRSDKL
jgi:hypothetical protein